MDAGGLAQMSYKNNFSSTGGLGLPGAGFASRGKGAQLKRISVASAPKVASISEDQVDNCSTPRTSRSYLLAGLRTAPKTPSALPSSAPYGQSQYRFGHDTQQYQYNQHSAGYSQNVPHTATGTTFNSAQQYGMSAGQQYYCLPEQVLAPPSMPYEQEEEYDPMEAHIRATELALAKRAQQLQQQLAALNLTAQQHGMNINGMNGMHQGQQPQTPITPQMGFYNQQLMNGVAPMVSEVAGQPGLYSVYNPMTGQQTYVMDPNVQQDRLANSPPPPTPSHATSFNDTVRRESSPQTESMPSPWASRSTSPPKKTPSPQQDVEPLPPPSANAFRRGHKKASSLAFKEVNSAGVLDGPKSAFTRPVGFPQTPMTGTFGPGQGRAGEHPVRQPRGPPPLEELVASPTAKHEGSKNFATRQRRRALKSLVKAGMERRHVQTGSGCGTPVSETELTFSGPSDNDSDSVRSSSSSRGSLSSRRSIGSLRAAVNGAIGSERQEMRRMNSSGSASASVDACLTAHSVSSDEGMTVGGKLVEISMEGPMPEQRRKMPLLALTNAEKRKSMVC